MRTKLAKSRGERAVGHVQRAWVAKVARKREIEARTQAATAEQLALRLARARAADLRTQHFATLIARHLRQFVQRRLRVAGSLRGWLAAGAAQGCGDQPVAPPLLLGRRRRDPLRQRQMAHRTIAWPTHTGALGGGTHPTKHLN